MDIAATVTTKGQITIPLEVRRALDLLPGDRVLFRLESGRTVIEPAESSKGGSVELKKLPDFFDLAGSVSTPEGVNASDWESQRQAAWSTAIRDR